MDSEVEGMRFWGKGKYVIFVFCFKFLVIGIVVSLGYGKVTWLKFRE